MGIFNDPWECDGVWLVVLARAGAGAACLCPVVSA